MEVARKWPVSLFGPGEELIWGRQRKAPGMKGKRNGKEDKIRILWEADSAAVHSFVPICFGLWRVRFMLSEFPAVLRAAHNFDSTRTNLQGGAQGQWPLTLSLTSDPEVFPRTYSECVGSYFRHIARVERARLYRAEGGCGSERVAHLGKR